jgi:hypothetical protein
MVRAGSCTSKKCAAATFFLGYTGECLPFGGSSKAGLTANVYENARYTAPRAEITSLQAQGI